MLTVRTGMRLGDTDACITMYFWTERAGSGETILSFRMSGYWMRLRWHLVDSGCRSVISDERHNQQRLRKSPPGLRGHVSLNKNTLDTCTDVSKKVCGLAKQKRVMSLLLRLCWMTEPKRCRDARQLDLLLKTALKKTLADETESICHHILDCQ